MLPPAGPLKSIPGNVRVKPVTAGTLPASPEVAPTATRSDAIAAALISLLGNFILCPPVVRRTTPSVAPETMHGVGRQRVEHDASAEDRCEE